MTQEQLKKIVIDPNKWNYGFTFPKTATAEEKRLVYLEVEKSRLTGQPIEIHPSVQPYPLTPVPVKDTSVKPEETKTVPTPVETPKTPTPTVETVPVETPTETTKPAEPAAKTEPVTTPTEPKPVEAEAKKE